MAHVGLGEVAYAWNELERAETQLQQGLTLVRPWHNWETMSAGYLGLARIAAARQQWAVAESLLSELVDGLSPLQAPWDLPLVQAQRAFFAVQRGDLDAAAAWVEATDLTVDGPPLYVREPELLILARVLVALGRLDAAADLSARLLTAAEAGGRYGRVIGVLICQALTWQAQGQPAATLSALRRAVTLAEPQGYVRIFADAGEALTPLLAAVDILPVYVGRLRAALRGVINQAVTPGAPVPATPPGLLEPLSARELELLRLLAAGRTNQEIAAALTVSLNTVKTHIQSIFGKLAVRNRTEATLRARELGLL
jgi:LuxR family maltose regulon positive regulatory protein